MEEIFTYCDKCWNGDADYRGHAYFPGPHQDAIIAGFREYEPGKIECIRCQLGATGMKDGLRRWFILRTYVKLVFEEYVLWYIFPSKRLFVKYHPGIIELFLWSKKMYRRELRGIEKEGYGKK